MYITLATYHCSQIVTVFKCKAEKTEEDSQKMNEIIKYSHGNCCQPLFIVSTDSK